MKYCKLYISLNKYVVVVVAVVVERPGTKFILKNYNIEKLKFHDF